MKAGQASRALRVAPVVTAVALGVAALVAGCGGSDSSSSTATPAAATLSGTAATGSALANANVAVTDSAGNSPCVETTITTTALGSYTCTLKSGETAPFFVVVTDPTGNTAPLVSVTTTTPPAGTPLTLNATPLTTAIVAQLSPDGNPLTLVASKTVDATALKTITANVVAQLASVLQAIGAPANYDPFLTSISAGTASSTGNTADQVLDIVKVTKDPSSGQQMLSTVDGTPTPLATSTSGGTQLSAPAANVSSLPLGAQALAKALTACFALPASQRVLGTDTTLTASQGGWKVTSMASACQNIASDTSNAGGIAFLHNGYAFGQWIYGLLNSDTMTGAKFSVPEVMAYYSAASASSASGQDEAVLNIKYLDANGNPGNLIVLARYIASGASSAHASNWWVVGNQQPVEVIDRLQVRRLEQVNPGFTGTSANSNSYSHFQTGIQFWVNAKGPGSVNGNGNLSFARVTGPGLPTSGVVYIAPTGDSNEPTQVYMDVSNKTGTVPGTTRCSNNIATYNCPNFWFARTAGLTGSAATTLAVPPGSANNPVWAQPASDTLDSTPVTKGARYQIELFYGSQTTPDHVYHKTLLTDLVQATQVVNLPWNTPGSQTLAALDPSNSGTNGALSSLSVDWLQNQSAQQIGSAAVTVDTHGTYSGSTFVPKGATSVLITLPNSQQVPALPSTGTRSLLFSYRMLDNSLKSAVYTYN
ncbi:hypothetical protein [uncultured Ralstonia sp.]|jgi:hypothetical protein|uniref:hypothetical protein n=1 Tax=Ralstonia sp. TaxID=54061 RepID=UPI0025D24FD6|nr:hypothetical protein [uncultured Ralstonia sp.]